MSKRFIAGIYNYCDYWCDRCPFTGRCRNFSMGRELEREAEGAPPVDDAVNAAFWSSLAEKLRETTLLKPDPALPPDDTPEFDDLPDPAYEARANARRATIRMHPLSRLANDYRRRAGAWLNSADADLKTVAANLIREAEGHFATSAPEETARQIGDMLDVVAWYHTLIPPKVGRALSGLLKRTEDVGEFADIINESHREDANGSGKVALIAIERSIAAWLRLREILPAHEDEILALLSTLGRLRTGIQTALPGAQAFRRPGFDFEPTDDEPDE